MLMNLFFSAAVAVGSVALLSGTSGCASNAHEGHTDHAAHAAASGGMMCPKCESVWLTQVTDQGTKMQRLSSSRQMTCPDCDAMAAAYVKDGKRVLHNCPDCKVTPQEVKPTAVSHPKGTHS